MQDEKMNINWYPGHMTRAKRAMEEDVSKVDLLIELLDARIPRSSGNPDILRLSEGKSRLVLFNKSDLAEEAETRAWIRAFEENGILAIALDGRTKTALNSILKAIPVVCRDRIEKMKKKGYLRPQIKAMVAGIPNVGKSTVMNSLSGRASMKTGNKPGVTKGNQWLRVSDELMLLDTPGLLWPKFEDEEVGLHIAMIGSLNDEIVDKKTLAWHLIREILLLKPEALLKRYGIENASASTVCDANDILTEIAVNRGLLKSGGVPDIDRASGMLLTEFRSGKLGPLTLERVR